MEKIINETANKNTTWNDDNHAGTYRWSYIIDLIHTKTNTRYLLRSNKAVY